jgi:hypothetical protein
MCSICDAILSTPQAVCIPHTEALCPLRMSRYCSYCAKFGHLTTNCHSKPSKLYTQPAYVEQLIPYTEIIAYQIHTKTLLEEIKEEPAVRRLEVKNVAKVITAKCSALGLKSVKGKTKKQLLEEYAELNGMRVVYVS